MSNELKNNPVNSLLIVIVNYKTPSLTIDCLRSLADEIPGLSNTQVVVADNASGDGSAVAIKNAIANENWGSWASVMALEHNGGFAFGNNAVIRPALKSNQPPDYVLLLNPDTIVRPRAIKTLVEFMSDHPQVGIAGSRLEEPDSTPQCSAFRFHTVLSELDSGLRLGIVSTLLSEWVVWPPIPDQPCPTDWVAGASMIIRREVFEQVGLIDEAYFMYYEEMDFCLQAQRAGWECWYVPESRVVHLVGQSSGVTDTKRPPKRRPQYVFDSRRRYFLKNYGWFYAALADHTWASSYLLWQLRRMVQGKPDNDPPQLLTDFLRNSVFCKGGAFSSPKIS
ncbi:MULTISPECIES: glycosyltransferase family 2 protein [Moorena]|uniref:Putative glycosyltransferase n=1 Tax=Moorena producens 3L TaxID=489825 RepID=F4XX12_9CYAN|nr:MULTISPECIES: glycosyltransferase family 2 protein [Moorena]EGJ30897.1 putative glycosyltransferase [Moorena producens 3L]NEP64859.1 glycosyltransferase family 2 protein [Moorena sp. SIO3A5]NER87478.1 glycosyltransferase family 2 protein [Moorena sp. SIO3A2]NET66824.1 glycosyltransferase family 2 protein [Moorena sp. SIO1G6]OLT66780.1 glycosyl transferase family 2 [Moorena producens 3L]